MHTLTPLNSSLPHFPLPGSCNCGLKMETDRPNLENSDQVGSTSDDQGATEVMSYKCSFCKRGFSNAQALGGHMNIHRRVRAKLKEPSNSTSLFSLDIMKNRQFFTGSNSLDLNSEEKGCTLGSPLIIPREGGGVVSREEIRTGEIRQLPLFVEMPSGVEDRKSVGCSGRSDERKMQSSDGSEGVELDLELRLGPEPQDTSRTGTKQFF